MAARFVAGAREDRSVAQGDRAERRTAPRYHGDPAAWEEFKTAYYAELEQPSAQSAVRELCDRLTREPVTLLFAARDEARNNAVALKEWLDQRVK
jgi:uncharacterized protein YeaO (DUF488 family)